MKTKLLSNLVPFCVLLALMASALNLTGCDEVTQAQTSPVESGQSTVPAKTSNKNDGRQTILICG